MRRKRDGYWFFNCQNHLLLYSGVYIIIRMGYIVLLLLLSISNQLTSPKTSIYNAVQKYFHREIETQFYVSVGVNEEVTEVMLNQFRTWRSLFVISDRSQIASSFLEYVETNFILADTNIDPRMNVLQFTLSEICQKYYLRKPKFLILAQKKVGLSLLQSNDWKNRLCVPEVIFIQKTEQQQNIWSYLSTLGYEKLGQGELFLQFALSAHIEDILQISPTFLQPNYMPINNFEIIAQLPTFKKPVAFYFMTSTHFIVDNLLETMPQKNGEVDIFVMNFIVETDSIVLGGSYEADFVDIGGYSFWKISVDDENGTFINFYIFISQKDRASQVKFVDSEGKKYCEMQSLETIEKAKNETISDTSTQINRESSNEQEEALPVPISEGQYPLDEQQQNLLIYYIVIAILLIAISIVLLGNPLRSQRASNFLTPNQGNFRISIEDSDQQQIIRSIN